MTSQMGSSLSRDAVPPLEGFGGAATDFGLVVGINDYPRFRSLNGAVNDALYFRDWLRAEDGGNVAEDNVRLVLSQAEPPKPVQEQVDEALLYLVQKANDGNGRRLYFHFSGHGTGIPWGGNDVALLLATWSENFARLALSKNKYSGKLAHWQVFKEVVILLDCCRTNTVNAAGVKPTITYEPTPRFPTKLFIAYATDPGGTAKEFFDGKQCRGKFTSCLLKILRREPGITAKALGAQLVEDLERCGQKALVHDELQTSRFGRPGRLPMLRITFARARGKVWLRDNTRSVIDTWHVDRGAWETPREANYYKVEDETGAFELFEHDGRLDQDGPVATHIEF